MINPIEVENLSISIEGNTILKNINIKVKNQETIIILGKNSSGKTVLLKSLVGGLFEPTHGHLRIFGKDWNSMKNKEIVKIRKKMGYVFQQSALFDFMNTIQNVMFPLVRLVKKSFSEAEEISMDALKKLGLQHAALKKPSELSGGMRKRVGIARSIVLYPSILLMDDPTAGLDPVLTDSIADICIELKEKFSATLLITTNDFKFAYKLADKIVLMVDGRIHSILKSEEFQYTDDPYIKQFREGLLEGPISVID